MFARVEWDGRGGVGLGGGGGGLGILVSLSIQWYVCPSIMLWFLLLIVLNSLSEDTY